MASDYTPFSVREGIVPRKAIQWQSMDDALRNAIWNFFTIEFWQHFTSPMIEQKFTAYERLNLMGVRIWANVLDEPIDRIPGSPDEFLKRVRTRYMQLPWHKAYDMLDYSMHQLDLVSNQQDIIEHANTVLKHHNSPYRFISSQLVAVTSENEIKEVEYALNTTTTSQLRAANHHLSLALEHMSRRVSPDYRNSIKESISAVEAICKVLAGTPKADLGAALSTLMTRKQLPVHSQFRQALSNLYSFTNDAEGIRHSLKDEPTLDIEDARFMLVTCSAFVNYLLVKADKAGIDLTSQAT